jgi:hypothetical protein
MAEKSAVPKKKQKTTAHGVGKKNRRNNYSASGRRERNNRRNALTHELHLLKAAARRCRNHPEKFTASDHAKAIRLADLRRELGR